MRIEYVYDYVLKGVRIMTNSKSLKGIGLFQQEIIHLISNGAKETIGDIEKSMGEGKLIEYLYNKYQDKFSVPFDDSTYNNEALNKYFQDYSGYVDANEERKYGIMDENDGLLLILALIGDKIEISAVDWTI